MQVGVASAAAVLAVGVTSVSPIELLCCCGALVDTAGMGGLTPVMLEHQLTSSVVLPAYWHQLVRL